MPTDPLQGFGLFMQGLNTLPRAGQNIEAEQRAVQRTGLQNQAIDALLGQIADPGNAAQLQAAPQSALAALFAPNQQDALKLLSQRVAQDQTLTQNIDNEIALQKERESQFADTLPGLVTSLGGNEEIANTIETATRAKRYDTANNLLAQLFARGTALAKARAGSGTPNRELEKNYAYGRALAYHDDKIRGVLPSIVGDALMTNAGIDLNDDDTGKVLAALDNPNVHAAIVKGVVGAGAAGRSGAGQVPRAEQIIGLFKTYLQLKDSNPGFGYQLLATLGRAWGAGQIAPQAVTGAGIEAANVERAGSGIDTGVLGGELNDAAFNTDYVDTDSLNLDEAANALGGQ